MEGQGKAMGDITSLVGALTDGPLRERLLALLVQESPYPEEMIDRLLADTIRKIRERSNQEKGQDPDAEDRRGREGQRPGIVRPSHGGEESGSSSRKKGLPDERRFLINRHRVRSYLTDTDK